MAFLREYILPFVIVLIFGVALLAVSARIFLPDDLAAPAPIEEVAPSEEAAGVPSAQTIADLPPSLSVFVQGLPDNPAQAAVWGARIN